MTEELTRAVLERQVESLETEVVRLNQLLARPVAVTIAPAPQTYVAPSPHDMSMLTAIQSLNGTLGSIAMSVREIADSMKGKP